MNGARFRRNPAAVWRASSGFLVAAVPPHAPSTVVGSAAMVWAALEVPRTIDEVVITVVSATGAEAEAVQRDTEALLHELVPLGLVEQVQP